MSADISDFFWNVGRYFPKRYFKWGWDVVAVRASERNVGRYFRNVGRHLKHCCIKNDHRLCEIIAQRLKSWKSFTKLRFQEISTPFLSDLGFHWYNPPLLWLQEAKGSELVGARQNQVTPIVLMPLLLGILFLSIVLWIVIVNDWDHVGFCGYYSWWRRSVWVYFEVFDLIGGLHVRNEDLRRVISK